MAFEALLRCGSNVVIPGTDSNSKRYASLASAMGLWITHHHAEPLGAEMFLRAYPDKNPSFKEHPDLFRHLWKEGIERQKKERIIWNLGFRGQGDTPFWEQDPFYDTPTAYLLRQFMGYVRNVGDGPYFYQWQRLIIYPEKDRKILLLLNEENHMTDEELYAAMKERQGELNGY